MHLNPQTVLTSWSPPRPCGTGYLWTSRQKSHRQSGGCRGQGQRWHATERKNEEKRHSKETCYGSDRRTYQIGWGNFFPFKKKATFIMRKSNLELVLADIRWRGEGGLWVDEMMMNISLRWHKHQTTADTGKKRQRTGYRGRVNFHHGKGFLFGYVSKKCGFWSCRLTFWCHQQCFQDILRKWPQMSLSLCLSDGENRSG